MTPLLSPTQKAILKALRSQNEPVTARQLQASVCVNANREITIVSIAHQLRDLGVAGFVEIIPGKWNRETRLYVFRGAFTR